VQLNRTFESIGGLSFSELVGVHPSAAAYHFSIMTTRTTPTHALYATASNWFAT
jgi:hypothetical protein